MGFDLIHDVTYLPDPGNIICKNGRTYDGERQDENEGIDGGRAIWVHLTASCV